MTGRIALVLPVVFLGYAFKWPQIRDAVTAAANGIATVICADDTLTSMHRLEKIQEMMLQADLCLFDLTGQNVNVATEYGIARGLRWIRSFSTTIQRSSSPPNTSTMSLATCAESMFGTRRSTS
jgi:hypothetical protein